MRLPRTRSVAAGTVALGPGALRTAARDRPHSQRAPSASLGTTRIPCVVNQVRNPWARLGAWYAPSIPANGVGRRHPISYSESAIADSAPPSQDSPRSSRSSPRTGPVERAAATEKERAVETRSLNPDLE